MTDFYCPHCQHRYAAASYRTIKGKPNDPDRMVEVKCGHCKNKYSARYSDRL